MWSGNTNGKVRLSHGGNGALTGMPHDVAASVASRDQSVRGGRLGQRIATGETGSTMVLESRYLDTMTIYSTSGRCLNA